MAYSDYFGNDRLHNQYGEELCVTSILCNRCRNAFSSSKILNEFLSSGETNQESSVRFTTAVASFSKEERERINRNYIEKMRQSGLQAALDFIQSTPSQKQTELISIHQNTAEITDGMTKDKCHICTMIWALKYETQQDSSSGSSEETGSRLEITSEMEIEIVPGNHHSGSAKPTIKIQFSRDDNIDDKLAQYTIRIRCRLSLALLGQELDSITRSEMDSVQYGTFNFSKDHGRLAGFWLNECQLKHPTCWKLNGDFAPTRLVEILDVKTDGTAVVRLSQHHSNQVLYFTLSYCWGSSKNIFYLNEAVLKECEQEIPWTKIPKTIQHAIIITKAMGYQFIWVDSLCIMKDNQEDWLKESASMGLVYQHSTCTIAAELSNDARSGIFTKRNPLPHLPCRVLRSESKNMFVTTSRYDKKQQHRYGNLNSRAWCFQERLLSRHILVFHSNGLVWVCNQGEADEWNPEGNLKIRTKDPNSSNDLQDAALFGKSIPVADWEPESQRRETSIGKHEFKLLLEMQLEDAISNKLILHRHWFALVGPYCRGSLTEGKDRLIALTGVATLVKQNLPTKYLAGLWEHSIWFDLLWYLAYDPKNPRPRTYRAPTWS